MFVQIIEGKTSDADALRAGGDRWLEELAPGAVGFEGVTAGVAPDGTAITIVRFTDRASAEANAARPEQTAFWEQQSSHYDGEPSFRESENVDTFLDGGSDDAGFVQVMEVTYHDRAGALAMEDQFMEKLRDVRPDLIGGTRIWVDDSHTVEVNYFTSEAEARANEAKMAEGVGDDFADYMKLAEITRFIDLPDPILH